MPVDFLHFRSLVLVNLFCCSSILKIVSQVCMCIAHVRISLCVKLFILIHNIFYLPHFNSAPHQSEQHNCSMSELAATSSVISNPVICIYLQFRTTRHWLNETWPWLIGERVTKKKLIRGLYRPTLECNKNVFIVVWTTNGRMANDELSKWSYCIVHRYYM